MRTLASTFFSACLLYSLASCNKESNIACEVGSCTISKPLDTYDYPIKGGSPEWAQFTTSQQMLDACQIPADTLAKISTEGLIQSCIDFPLMGDLLLNIDVNVPGALKNKMATFSGLIELCKRQDVGVKMINRYLTMYPSCIDSYGSYNEKARFTSQFTAYEMMISYDSIIAKMSLADKKILIKEALQNYNCKRLQRNNYAYYDFSTSLYIPTKIMMQENYAPFVNKVSNSHDLQIFIEKLLLAGTQKEVDDMFAIIVQHANEFIK